MTSITITYRDSSGEISRRNISDIQPEGADSIEAFCHSRNARRIFKLSNIVAAVNVETGEVISNVWKAFGLSTSPDGRERLVSVVGNALSGVKALKFFALTTRGFAKRERSHLIAFIKQFNGTACYTDAEIEQWLQELWCADAYAFLDGNTAEYQALLDAIPSALKKQCRSVALAIATGSGRQPIAPELLLRISTEFGSEP